QTATTRKVTPITQVMLNKVAAQVNVGSQLKFLNREKSPPANTMDNPIGRLNALRNESLRSSSLMYASFEYDKKSIS
ncbi:MAG: hypothetical protein R6U40_01970, partial [Desulfobacterales bacterium]